MKAAAASQDFAEHWIRRTGPLLWILLAPVITVPLSHALVLFMTGPNVCRDYSQGWLGGEASCPDWRVLIALSPGLLNLVPFIWLRSDNPDTRRAAILAAIQGSLRLIVPVMGVLTSGPGVGCPNDTIACYNPRGDTVMQSGLVGLYPNSYASIVLETSVCLWLLTLVTFVVSLRSTRREHTARETAVPNLGFNASAEAAQAASAARIVAELAPVVGAPGKRFPIGPLLWIVLTPLITIPVTAVATGVLTPFDRGSYSSYDAVLAAAAADHYCTVKFSPDILGNVAGQATCPDGLVLAALSPGLLNLLPVLWLISRSRETRLAAKLALTLGALRFIAPIIGVLILAPAQGAGCIDACNIPHGYTVITPGSPWASPNSWSGMPWVSQSLWLVSVLAYFAHRSLRPSVLASENAGAPAIDG